MRAKIFVSLPYVLQDWKWHERVHVFEEKMSSRRSGTGSGWSKVHRTERGKLYDFFFHVMRDRECIFDQIALSPYARFRFLVTFLSYTVVFILFHIFSCPHSSFGQDRLSQLRLIDTLLRKYDRRATPTNEIGEKKRLGRA